MVIALILIALTIALAAIVPRLLDVRFSEGPSKARIALRAAGGATSTAAAKASRGTAKGLQTLGRRTANGVQALGRTTRAAGAGASRVAVRTARRSGQGSRSFRSRLRGGVRAREQRRRGSTGLEPTSSKPRASSRLVLTVMAVGAGVALIILLTIRAMEDLFREIVS